MAKRWPVNGEWSCGPRGSGPWTMDHFLENRFSKTDFWKTVFLGKPCFGKSFFENRFWKTSFWKPVFGKPFLENQFYGQHDTAIMPPLRAAPTLLSAVSRKWCHSRRMVHHKQLTKNVRETEWITQPSAQAVSASSVAQAISAELSYLAWPKTQHQKVLRAQAK